MDGEMRVFSISLLDHLWRLLVDFLLWLGGLFCLLLHRETRLCLVAVASFILSCLGFLGFSLGKENRRSVLLWAGRGKPSLVSILSGVRQHKVHGVPLFHMRKKKENVYHFISML
jgi:hypothetical protein